MSLPTIGIIGIGNIGLPVANNLIQAGYKVAGFKPDNCDDFCAVGGIPLGSAAEVTGECEVLLLCLPSEAAEMKVLEGSADTGGVLSSLKPNQLVIDLGSYDRDFKAGVAKRIEERGGQILEAEVGGSPVMVRERRAALFLGGKQDLVAQATPILQSITQNIFHIGEFGTALTMKLIANYLLTIHTLAAAEAINLGIAAGFDPNQVVDVVGKSAGGSTMLAIRGPLMARQEFTPAPGPFTTLEKYLDMGEALSKQLGCAAPLFSTALPYYRRAIDMGLAHEDISAVIKLIAADSKSAGR